MFYFPLFLASCYACTLIASNLPSCKNKIIDIVHEYFPPFQNSYFSDVGILLQIIYTIATIPYSSLNEIFLVMSIVQFFRILCFSTTILPPLKRYNDKIRLFGLNGSGTEYIFSGHACYACISFIYLYKHDIFPLYVLIPYNFITQFLVVLSRNHYTVDVILSWIITPLVYNLT